MPQRITEMWLFILSSVLKMLEWQKEPHEVYDKKVFLQILQTFKTLK